MSETERIHYPKSARLKEACIGLLGVTCNLKRAEFTANECYKAICEHNEWAIDIATNRKKARKLLEELVGTKKYVQCIGLTFRIRAYDSETLTSFTDMSSLLAAAGDDRYMSEYLEPVDELICTPWNGEDQTFHSMEMITEEAESIFSAEPIKSGDEDSIVSSFISTEKQPGVVLHQTSPEIEESFEDSSEVDGVAISEG